jgi:hypothetical protein
MIFTTKSNEMIVTLVYLDTISICAVASALFNSHNCEKLETNAKRRNRLRAPGIVYRTALNTGNEGSGL